MSHPALPVEIAGRAFPFHTEPRCRTCRHPRRLEAERLVAQGVPFAAVVARLGMSPEVTGRNLRAHVRAEHVPFRTPVLQSLADATAQEVTSYVLPAVTTTVAHLGLARAVVERVRDRLASGDEQPTVRDGLAAARLLAESSPQAADHGQYMTAFAAIVEAAQEVVPRDEWDQFRRRARQAIAVAFQPEQFQVSS